MLSVVVLLGGCNSQDVFSRYASPEDQANARYNIELLQQHRFAELTKNLEPTLQGPELPVELEKMAAGIPAGQPTSVKLVSAGWFRIAGETKRTMSFEYEFPGRWVLADLTTVTSDGSTRIIAFHVKPLADSLENQNRFTLHGKGMSQYLMLAIAVADILFCISVFVVCLRTPALRKKWLWAILCFVSAFRINVNWTTGEFTSNLFFLTFPPASMESQLYGPWIVYAGVPVGAIVFLVYRAALRKRDSDPLPAAPPDALSRLFPS